jgi:thiol:disulfide interchange protein DsbD
MKKLVLLIAFLVIGFTSFSQIHNPVTWTTSVEKINDTEYDLIINASIEPKWHLYSQNVPEDGPIPTTFTFEKSDTFELVGKVSEEEGHIIDDPVFQMKIKFFENNATFKQRIKVTSDSAFEIMGEVEFMVCDDTSCLPPSYVDLPFEIKGSGVATAGVKKEEVKEKTKLKKDKKEEKKSLIGIFILAFLGGFAALLTPCVFPMIPMTVSFFTKQSKDKATGIRNAIFYGISIIVIYVALGVAVSAIFGADALNALSTNVWFNVIFFLLLMIFAISFLGAFEITLPSSWGTKVDSQADRGGLIGIFFMALALAIVSFSCTGPIVGTLLVEAAAGGSQIGPIVGMLGFSLALAIPFALFAAFPGWMNSLPKSGGWLNTVKVVLGFLEMALAFKFLSNADLVLQLHWLEREVFLAIWIAIFGTMALYLFGKIKLPHDSPLTHISVGRLSLGLITLAFTIYMIPGLWGAPLNLISAFPPAQHYSESPYGVGFTKLGGGGASADAHSELPNGGHLMPPHNILAFHDYNNGLAYAKEVNKPVMIDFTGHACVNCRKMEQNVWAKDKVLALLKNEIVLISLYVDDKRPLPDGPENISKLLRPGKKFKHIGQKWAEFQALKYGANAQPYYVLMNHDEENLIDPVAYTPDVDEYYNWLKEGIGNFK